MKVKAVFKCGHDATRDFDLRNRSNRIDQHRWPDKAKGLDCYRCRQARLAAVIKELSANELRRIALVSLQQHCTIEQLIDVEEV